MVEKETIKNIYHIGDSTEFGLTELKKEQSGQLNELLEEFKDIFAKDKRDYGLLVFSFYNIDTGDSPPFKLKPYRKSCAEEKILSLELKNLLDTGLIQPLK